MQDQDRSKEELLGELAFLRRQASLLHAVPLGIHECDCEGRITFVNPSQESITGYTADELVGTHIWDRVEPGSQKDSLRAYLRQLVVDQPRPTPYCATNTRKNGEVFDVRVDWSYLRNPQGQVTGFVSVVSDITEQRRADEALQESEERYRTLAESLRQSEERFRSLVETTSDWVWAADRDGCYTYSSPKVKDLLGYAPDDVLGKTPFDFMPPDEAERISRLFMEFARSLKSFTGLENTNVHRDGRLVILETSGVPILDAEGNLLGYQGIDRDITDRKRAEEALKKAHDELERRVQVRTAQLTNSNEHLQRSQAELQTVYDNMADGLLIVDCATGRLLRTNPAICRMLGHSEGELLSLSIEDVHPAKVSSIILEKIRTQPEGQGILTESRPMVRKDGTVFYTDISNIRTLYQGRPCVIGLCRDITERKRTQEALQQAHDELRAIYDGMVDGLHILNLETLTPVRANPALCRMMGYVEGEVLSLTPAAVHPSEELPGIMQGMQACAEGRTSGAIDVPIVRKDGSVFYADIVASRIVYNGSPSLVCFFRDATERKRAESRLTYLASFPEKNPNPVVELGLDGDIRYVNPAAQRLFPELREQGMNHPWLRNWEVVVRQFVEGQDAIVVHEVRVGDRWSQESFSYIAQDQVIRIYGLDITERKQAHEALKKEHWTLKHLLQSSDHERQLIAYEIHDTLAQQLAGSLMQFDTFAHLKDKQPKQAGDAFHAGLTMLRQSHYETRRLIAGVRPPILDESGLVEAIAHLVNELRRHKGPKIEFRNSVDFDRLVPVLDVRRQLLFPLNDN